MPPLLNQYEGGYLLARFGFRNDFAYRHDLRTDLLADLLTIKAVERNHIGPILFLNRCLLYSI